MATQIQNGSSGGVAPTTQRAAVNTWAIYDAGNNLIATDTASYGIPGPNGWLVVPTLAYGGGATNLTITVPVGATIANGYSAVYNSTGNNVSAFDVVAQAGATAPSAANPPGVSAVTSTSFISTAPALPAGATSLALQIAPDNAGAPGAWAAAAGGPFVAGGNYSQTGLTAGGVFWMRAVSTNQYGSTNGNTVKVSLSQVHKTAAAGATTLITGFTALPLGTPGPSAPVYCIGTAPCVGDIVSQFTSKGGTSDGFNVVATDGTNAAANVTFPTYVSTFPIRVPNGTGITVYASIWNGNQWFVSPPIDITGNGNRPSKSGSDKVPISGQRVFGPDGTERPTGFVQGQVSWEILHGAVQVGSSANPRGWGVNWDGSQFVVQAPNDPALPQDGTYKVRLEDGH